LVETTGRDIGRPAGQSIFRAVESAEKAARKKMTLNITVKPVDRDGDPRGIR
jgi:hypothetical protein